MVFKFMYIGKNYEGLVIQNHTHKTVEHFLFSALKKASLIESVEKANYSRCGRTDAGVSATGNVFNLNVRYKEKEEMDYLKILNNILPKDIIIWAKAEVDTSFDSRFSCLYREYKYYFLRKNMNVNLIKQAAEKLEGTHNFKNFCKIDKSDHNYLTKNYERRIYEFQVDKYEKFIFPYNNQYKRSLSNETNKIEHESYFDMFQVTIKGSAFLWHQVRCMMGILFLIGNRLEDISIIDEMFNVNSGKVFNYEIASDFPLILYNCEFEGIEFKTSLQNSAENYFKLVDFHEQNLIQMYMSSFSFDYLNNLIRTSTEIFNLFNKDADDFYMKNCNFNQAQLSLDANQALDMIGVFEGKYRKKRNYTKLLNQKINRAKK